MKTKTLYIIIAGLVLSLLFSFVNCSRERTTSNDNMAALTDTVTHYKNALGTQTASVKTLELDKKQANNLLLKKDAQLAALVKEFAKVHYVTKYVTTTRIDTISVAFTDTIPCVFERTDTIKRKWYSFTYSVNQNGLKIDSLQFKNTATVISGVKRKWFLGKETLFTEITNTNPYIKVNEIKAAEISLPTPIYKKWWVWLGMGLAGGVLIK